LEIRPSDAEALRTYGYFLVSDGRFQQAIEHYRKALEVDPMQVRAYFGLAMTLILAGRFEDLPELTERLASHRDEQFMQRWNRNIGLMTLRYKGLYAELIEVLPENPESLGDLQDAAVAYYHTGNEQRAREYLDQMIEIANERSDDFSEVAAVFAQMNQPDRAIEYLEKAMQAREVNFAFIRVDPDLVPLHEDPRFIRLLDRAGLKPVPSSSAPLTANSSAEAE
jgi:tetratricopeptide (TPR) repeat protein